VIVQWRSYPQSVNKQLDADPQREKSDEEVGRGLRPNFAQNGTLARFGGLNTRVELIRKTQSRFIEYH